ncbi:MAG: MMPL family transporter [Gammaproteobacteria bacterium]|nr:MMPL family transporter [Gammaproteobacteria bacterium]
MNFRLAHWIMARRGAVSIAFLILTLLFMGGLPTVQIRTVFKDLLPMDDPFVKLYLAHPTFGNPMTMAIMVKRKNGDIYHSDTLHKVWNLTRDIDKAPSIDHDQIISIATEKLRYAEATAEGVDAKPVMNDWVPKDGAEMEDFKHRVNMSINARAYFISPDESATLINAAFLDTIEYGESFAYVQKLVEAARDADHDVYLVGQPVLTAWVYKLQKQTYAIFGVTVAALVLALVFYMRNIAGVVTPIVCTLAAGLWGFGFIGWLGRPIEPLLMIVPLLLVARSFSHCVQFIERYYEVLMHLKDRVKAAEVTMGLMMAPSVLGIMTDVCGIVFIAIAPIRTMTNHAIFCGMWALWIIPTGVFLCAILLSYLPVPRNMEEIIGGKDNESGIHLLQDRLLNRMSRLTFGANAKWTALVVIAISVYAGYLGSLIKIGNPVEGSNLLWPDSEFNTGVRAVNAHFPGSNTLEIVLESKTDNNDYRVALQPDATAVRVQLQRALEADAVMPPRATLSFTDYMSETTRLVAGGNPKWAQFNLDPDTVHSVGFATQLGTNTINFGHVANFTFQHSTVSAWYKDNKQETVDAALDAARRAVAAVGEDHPDFKVRLATGVISLQQAMNNVVERYHTIIMLMVNLAVMVLALIAYRSLVAAVILLIPVNLSNIYLVAAMQMLGVGLDVNAGIVAVMGVGVGIDYGIYLLSRICEEYSAQGQDIKKAINAAMTTTGKAIMFTSSIMLVGILPWYFLSDLKFMADMGILLVAVMLINMLLSLLVLPLLVWFIQPSFMKRTDLMLGENIDLTQFAAKVDAL